MSDTQETMTTEAAAPEATPEKPKRGRPRKKAEEAPAPALAAEGAEAPAAPAKKTTRRRAAAKPADEAAAPAATEAPAVEEAPKPRRTRVRKTAEPAAEEGAAAATPAAPATSETSEEAPKPRRARTRKAASEPAADAEEKAPQAKEPEGAEASAAGAGKSEAPAPADAPESKEAPRRERTTTTVIRRRDREERRQNQSGQNQNGQGQGKNSQNKQNAQNSQGGKKNKKNRHENRNREPQPSVSKEELTELKVADLRARAAEAGVDAAGLKKAELVDAIYEAVCKAEGFAEVTGVLDIMGDGYGFLRTSGYLPGENDIYVGLATIRKNGLRKGDMVTGTTRPARPNDKFAALQKVSAVNGMAPEIMALRPKFADLTPVFPDERLLMEHGKNTTTARVIDLTAPIGKGQRGLIVSPPKAGKTTVLKDIAAAITANNPDVHLMYLGIDERPEEATDMERSIRGEVVSSTFDMPSENHIQVAELVIERAKRLVEQGKDVVILLDSITRLARAYNLAQPASGRILSGGVDSTALYPPKRFLGAARNIENGGSLTILASALIETGSKMDEVIFEEFKGTGNMELKLDRYLADRRIFPAIDPISSGTRKEELLMDPQEAPLIWGVRRILANTNSTERAMDMLIKSLKQTNSNQEFLLRMAKKMQAQQGRADDGMEL
ncbi:transcription termination factor Rho [Adlercreutzia equolifaciens subsp. celatus]|uniref:Transcription termination factor Rho n=1 Tax=Adlercreutzia equolifaciens subsp. celatus TaxID=394340 RepID=A0A369P0D7_9ACTN|nr:transcription termination factor Rho [Adlercreutzia equolifaciens]RDC45571.1 transcription termination factor Rho [Adlercreutzia equolifaciens subsp. celatus]